MAVIFNAKRGRTEATVAGTPEAVLQETRPYQRTGEVMFEV